MNASLRKQFGELPERGQRASELMRHSGDKIGLKLSCRSFSKNAAGHGVTCQPNQQDNHSESRNQVISTLRQARGAGVRRRSRQVELLRKLGRGKTAAD